MRSFAALRTTGETRGLVFLTPSVWWTVRQIADSFDRECVSPGIAAAYDTGQLDLEYELIHAIEPNPNAAPRAMRPAGGLWKGRLSQELSYRSAWFERGASGRC